MTDLTRRLVGRGDAASEAIRADDDGPSRDEAGLVPPTPVSETGPARVGRLSRRRLLGTGLGVAGVAMVGGAGVAGLLEGDPGLVRSTGGGRGAATLTFRTRPDLTPPRVEMAHAAPPARGQYFFLTPNLGPSGGGQPGLMIVDEYGSLAWFKPIDAASTDLQVQRYRGEPVLTWWEGGFNRASGFGEGRGVIADTSYRQIATVEAANGLQVDLHELVLTPQGTALVTAYSTSTADLRPLGGPEKGAVYVGHVQEIDVATGKLLFEWSSLDHVKVDESYFALDGEPFDYFHINSIGVDPDDGNLLISSRNTWTVYKVDRRDGSVIWRLGGKRSDFTMGEGSSFAWQHHARAHGGGLVTIFDDGAIPQVEPQSRAIEVHLDATSMTASLGRAFTHPARLLAEDQGSFDLLADGGAIVGWGSEPYASHFAADGTLLRDGRMPTDYESYRAFRSAWTGTPTSTPDVVVRADNVGGHTVYVSWNGATEVATWQMLTGIFPDELVVSGSGPKAGFETAITLHSDGRYLAVRALDASGKPLATSRTVSLS